MAVTMIQPPLLRIMKMVHNNITKTKRAMNIHTQGLVYHLSLWHNNSLDSIIKHIWKFPVLLISRDWARYLKKRSAQNLLPSGVLDSNILFWTHLVRRPLVVLLHLTVKKSVCQTSPCLCDLTYEWYPPYSGGITEPESAVGFNNPTAFNKSPSSFGSPRERYRPLFTRRWAYFYVQGSSLNTWSSFQVESSRNKWYSCPYSPITDWIQIQIIQTCII